MNVDIEPSRHPSYSEAIDWFLQLKDQADNAQLLQAFEDWLKKDPMHEVCYLDVLALWDDLDEVDPLASVDITTTSLGTAGQVETLPEEPAKREASPGARWAVPMAALSLCFLLITVMLPPHYFGFGADYSTSTGEQELILLEDGSQVRLNAQSAIRVVMSADTRLIELLYGEAYFDVAKDSGRPFQVSAKQTKIEALGTQFNVDIGADLSIATQLVEGKVKAIMPNQEPIIMQVGQKLYWQEGQTAYLDKRLYTGAPGWIKGILRFDGQTLDTVVNQLNRHYGPRLQIVDPRLASIPVNGTMPLNNLDLALQLLEQSLEIRHVRFGGAVIALYR